MRESGPYDTANSSLERDYFQGRSMPVFRGWKDLRRGPRWAPPSYTRDGRVDSESRLLTPRFPYIGTALLFFVLVGAMSPASAQTAPPAASTFVARWLDVQGATVAIRHRHATNSAGVVTTNQIQHRETLRGRLKFDTRGRYALAFGVFTGPRFSSGWDNTGWGMSDAQKNLAVRTLGLAARAVEGIDAEAGGLTIARGESTEITSYDEDGYVTGERVRIRRRAQLFFDEISATNAYFTANAESIPISKRLPHIGKSNYQQFLLQKRIGKRAAVSADYTIETGRRTWREAVHLNVREVRVIDSVILENYQRTNAAGAYGFAVTVNKAIGKRLDVNGGYARIDPAYGALNSDRFNIGRRVFGMATYALSRELAASIHITTAVGRHDVLPQQRLSILSLTYNLLPALRRAGLR